MGLTRGTPKKTAATKSGNCKYGSPKKATACEIFRASLIHDTTTTKISTNISGGIMKQREERSIHIAFISNSEESLPPSKV